MLWQEKVRPQPDTAGGDAMNTTKRLRHIAAGLTRTARMLFSSQPMLRALVQAACAFLAGLVLSLAPLFDRPLPLALALVAAPGFGAAAVGALGGAACGYLLFWGFSAALELLAGGFLILAGACIFHDLLPRDKRWFTPACASALYALPGLVCLLGGRVHAFDVAFLLAKLALLGAATAVFSDALQHTGRGRQALALAFLAGCGKIVLPGHLPLSIILAAGAVFLAAAEPSSLFCAAACGLILDITCPQAHSMCAMLVFAALFCYGARSAKKLLRAAVYLGCCASFVLFTGGADAAALAGAAIGTLLALPIDARRFARAQTPCAPEREQTAEKLEGVAEILSYITRILDRDAACSPEPQSAAVFDRAAERVCRSCGKYGVCWNECAHDTYLALSGASTRILRRGCAVREDLPAFFLERCCHTGRFLTAVNEALDERLCRLQYQARLRESRSILADHYRFLARVLADLAAPDEPACKQPPRFTPELGFRARGVRADSVSGDYGCSFTCGEWYYVLLCDGMGTGREAENESRTAAKLLRGMIESGFDALGAMQLLNGVYILRQDGGFSTVDLLQVSLVTGEGFLHKWGAPPSYLLQDGEVIKIGTASPPPGLGAGETHQAECVKLSLQREQTLVLVSDGAAGDETEQYLGRCRDQPARELAAGILGRIEGIQTDDQTAVAIRLHPFSAHKKHSISKKRILSKPHI